MKLSLVFPYRQWTAYSCTAAVLQMVVRRFTGRHLSHTAAITVTRCRPNGCTMARLRRELRRFGLKSKVLHPGIRAFRRELDGGRLVVTDDNLTYVESHVALIHGHTASRFWLVDPVIGLPTLRDCRQVVRAAEEAFSVWS